jgi:hypothetical protein
MTHGWPSAFTDLPLSFRPYRALPALAEQAPDLAPVVGADTRAAITALQPVRAVLTNRWEDVSAAWTA